MKAPIVSVLMTSYNRENYIAEAIDSVLSSTLTDFELIISDDTSSDRTVEIARTYAAKDPRIKVFVNEKNLTDYPNRNRAASYATGKYLKYLDSDDVMYPHTLQVMVDHMEQFPEAGFGLCALHDDKPYPVVISSKQAYLEHFYTYGHFGRAPASSIIRRDAFEKVGGFTGENMIGDFQMWFILAREYPMVKIPPYLTWNREHPNQESRTKYAKIYPVLWKRVTDEALSHPACPLSPEEISGVQTMLKKKRRKTKVYGFLKKIVG
jgi:glycosyltransferase involved in cell wall biosynthesis